MKTVVLRRSLGLHQQTPVKLDLDPADADAGLGHLLDRGGEEEGDGESHGSEQGHGHEHAAGRDLVSNQHEDGEGDKDYDLACHKESGHV